MHCEPVTEQNWPLLAALFGAQGCPGYCWCLAWRAPNASAMAADRKPAALREFLQLGPIGVIAVEAGEAVGWCSAADRTTFARLRRSRTMPRVSELPTWTINCLFVKRMWRGRRLAELLVNAAAECARQSGAHELEAYPYDTAGISSTHQGHSQTFARCGLVPGQGRRWVLPLSAAT